MLADHLNDLIRDRQIDLVVCNAENAAGGSGMTPQIFDKLLKYGVDVVTLGDHVFRKKQIYPVLEQNDRILRPANLPEKSLGRRWTVVPTKDGRCDVAVTCLLGQMFMKNFDSPWAEVEKVWSELPRSCRVRVLDFHAEATSEKIAMGWHMNGRATAVFGTHTHVPTADACVLDDGTAYISDVGMTGPYDGVLGRRKEKVLSVLTTGMPTSFDIATADVRLCAVLVTAEATTGRATAIERVEIRGRTQDGPAYDADDGWGHRKR